MLALTGIEEGEGRRGGGAVWIKAKGKEKKTRSTAAKAILNS
jgi:hypothetical protein